MKINPFRKKQIPPAPTKWDVDPSAYDSYAKYELERKKMDLEKAMWEEQKRRESQLNTYSARMAGNFGNGGSGGSDGGGSGGYWAIGSVGDVVASDLERNKYEVLYTQKIGQLVFVACKHKEKAGWTVFADRITDTLIDESDLSEEVRDSGEPLNNWQVAAALFPDLDSQEFVYYEKPNIAETLVGVDLAFDGTSSNKLYVSSTATGPVIDATQIKNMNPGKIFPLSNVDPF